MDENDFNKEIQKKLVLRLFIAFAVIIIMILPITELMRKGEYDIHTNNTIPDANTIANTNILNNIINNPEIINLFLIVLYCLSLKMHMPIKIINDSGKKPAIK